MGIDYEPVPLTEWRDRYLAEEARADRLRVLRGCRNGLIVSGLLAVAAGVVFRRWWG